MNIKKPKVAIVGAGIAGLAAAYELQKAGFQVTVFESADYSGGRMLSSRHQGYTFDQGADFFSENYRTLESYAKELGIIWEDALARASHRVVRDQIAHEYNFKNKSRLLKLSMLSSRANAAFLFWLLRLRLSKLQGDFFYLSTLPSKFQEMSAFEYLSKYVHPEVAIYVADGFTSTMQFHRATEISAPALLAFMQMLIRPETQFSVRYTPPRIDEIPRALASRLNIKYNCPVSKITESNEGIEVITADYKEEFDACVIATPAPIASRIHNSASPELKNLFNSTRYAKTIVASLEVKGVVIPDTYMTFVPFLENKLIAGYTNESRKPGAGKPGMTYFNIYLHEEGAEELWNKTEEQICSAIMQELPKVFPEIRNLGSDLGIKQLKKWDLAMPKFSASHIKRVADWEKSKVVSRIVLAGDYLNSPWTEGAARSGIRASQEIQGFFASQFEMPTRIALHQS